jgi:CBS domain-containing protein
VTQTKSIGRTAEGIRPRHLSEERVRHITRHGPMTVASGSPLRAAIERMQAAGGDCVLVLGDGKLVGIITERDVLNRVLGEAADLGGAVDAVMTADPKTIDPEASVREAMERMESGGYRNLPLVTKDGRVVGVLRQQDILDYVAEAFPQEILNLPPRPHQRMEAPEGA